MVTVRLVGIRILHEHEVLAPFDNLLGRLVRLDDAPPHQRVIVGICTTPALDMTSVAWDIVIGLFQLHAGLQAYISNRSALEDAKNCKRGSVRLRVATLIS